MIPVSGDEYAESILASSENSQLEFEILASVRRLANRYNMGLNKIWIWNISNGNKNRKEAPVMDSFSALVNPCTVYPVLVKT